LTKSAGRIIGFFNALAHQANTKNICVQKNGVQKCGVQNFGHNKSGHGPPAAQTKPGLLSYQSFNHKNHSSDNTPTACYPPKKPGICHGLFFCLEADALK